MGCDQTFFDGLKVSYEKELCGKYMGKYPVISITLKGVDGRSFEAARESLRYLIGMEAMRFPFLEESSKLTEKEKASYLSLVDQKPNGDFFMSNATLEKSLQILSTLLSKHYGVKTNEEFQFAVLTGCLRISKESIFTGLNNFKIYTTMDVQYAQYFGFTDDEVKELLEYYDLSDHYDKVKEWYNGYQFGNQAMYCPWDVINYCYDSLVNPSLYPRNYWANTSGNAMIRRFIDKANPQTKNEIEQLVAGGSIIKEDNQELTYSELENSIENLWSVLFTTGYLTQRGQVDEDRYQLAIPNKEIRSLFVRQIQEWFKDTSREDTSTIEQFCSAFPKGETERIENILDDYLWNSISIRDTAVKTGMKENFYHGMLLGLLNYKQNWRVKSNAESGEGYSDILIETPDRIGVVIELKYAESRNLEKYCKEALEQIEEKQYDAILIDDGMKKIVKYGIAFYKKSCKVMYGEE